MHYRHAIGRSANCNNSRLRKTTWMFGLKKFWLSIKPFFVGALCGAAIFPITGISSKYTLPIFFPYRLVNDQMIICSDSPIPEVYDVMANRAKVVLARSPLYNDRIPLRIHICDANWKYSLFGSSNKETSGIFMADSGNIFINKHIIGDFIQFKDGNLIFNPNPDVNLLELKEVMIHEATHAVVFYSLGRSKHALLPKWISEGYAEYMAKTKMDDLKFEKNIRILNHMRPDRSAKSYTRYRLLVSYALDVKKIPLQQLLDNPPIQSDLEKELGLRSYSKSS